MLPLAFGVILTPKNTCAYQVVPRREIKDIKPPVTALFYPV